VSKDIINEIADRIFLGTIFLFGVGCTIAMAVFLVSILSRITLVDFLKVVGIFICIYAVGWILELIAKKGG